MVVNLITIRSSEFHVVLFNVAILLYLETLFQTNGNGLKIEQSKNNKTNTNKKTFLICVKMTKFILMSVGKRPSRT